MRRGFYVFLIIFVFLTLFSYGFQLCSHTTLTLSQNTKCDTNFSKNAKCEDNDDTTKSSREKNAFVK